MARNRIGLGVLALIVLAATLTAFAAPRSTHAIAPSVTWTSKAPMPTAREGIFVAAIADKIYAAGGGPGVCTFSSVLEEYNVTTDSWRTLASMPAARSNGGGAAAVDGKIYAMGGDDAFSGPVSVSTNEEYDPATDTWTPKADMPVGRVHHDAVAYGGRVFVFGGIDPAGVPLASVHAYDPSTDTWDVSLPDAPATINVARTAVIGTTAYVYDDDGDLYAFDLATNTWAVPDLASAPVGQSRALMVAHGGLVYVIGGTVAGAVVDDVRFYIPVTDSWQLLSPTAPWFTGRHALNGAAVNDKIYAIGGDLTLSPPYSPLTEEATIVPDAVGGVAIQPGIEALAPFEAPGSSGGSSRLAVRLAVSAAGALVLAGLAWFARRRLSRP